MPCCIVNTVPEITNFWKLKKENVCHHNAPVFNHCDSKSQNKITVPFFPNSHDCIGTSQLPFLLHSMAVFLAFGICRPF